MSSKSYTPEQKRAYAIRMKASRAKKIKATQRRTTKGKGHVSGYGTYKYRNQEPSLVHVGGELGRWLGKGADKIVKTLFGFGDYQIEHNTLMAGGLSPPEMVNSIDRGGFILRHREYIMDIAATTDFTVQTLPINPALESSFPWLAAVAAAFEEYEFRGLVYEFKSMSSDALLSSTTSTALGTVIMATQYNSLNPPFETKIQMENYEFANSSKPSCSFLHPVECKRSLTPVTHLYTRTETPTSGDIRLYDLGEFQVATQGMQAASGIIGELWCTFEIELYKPKLQSASALTNLASHWQLVGVTNLAPLGTMTPTFVAGSNLLAELTGLSITFPADISEGQFLLTYAVKGTGAAITNFSIVPTSNCTIPTWWQNNTSQFHRISNTTTTETYYLDFGIIITGPSATITLGDDGTLPASISSGDLWVTELTGEFAP